MLLLMGSAHPTHMEWRHSHLGRLVVPKDCGRVDETAAAGIPWAADNAAFSGFDRDAYLRMLDKIEMVPGCLFVTVPDVVGDAEATRALWWDWAGECHERELPAAWVAQDGAGPRDIPYDCAAVFVGGTDAYKLGQDARDVVRAAQARGLWVHVGRVNTMRRLRYCQSINADSVDGTKWSRFRNTYLGRGLDFLAGGNQLGLIA